MNRSAQRPPGWASKRQRLTKEQRLALDVVASHGPLTARDFARWRWPDAFTRTSSARGRVLFGAGATLAAGALLRALCADGLVDKHSEPTFAQRKPLLHYGISRRGEEELEAAEERAAKYGRPGPRGRAPSASPRPGHAAAG